MFLNKIGIKGFKSFADRIELDFISGITCIVGPNGSGKSNITDAIRWVLGEQKTSLLRGSKMEDLIFNGTEHRKPLNFAEVALYFDNSTGFFKSDFLEICLKRRFHRSGESEYFINDAPCRLKDIKEIIMDTGIGTDGYSIIGQGNIDNILSDNKFDRRKIFEEAAGIVKFNTKKNESVKRLDKVDDNLNRINDIILEVEGRIDPLYEESEKAKEFLSIEKKVKESEIKYLLDEYDKYKETSEILLKQKNESDDLLGKLSLQKENNEKDQIDIQNNIKKIKNQSEGLEIQYNHLSKEKDELNLDVKIREEKLNNRKQEIENFNRSLENEERHFNFFLSEIEESNIQLDLAEEKQKEDGEELIGLNDELENLSQQFKLMNSDKDELIKQIATYYSQLEVFKSEKKKSLEFTEKITNRYSESVEDEQHSKLEIEKLKKQLEENTKKRKGHQEEIENIEAVLKIKMDKRDQIEDELYDLKVELEEKNRKKYRVESEIELLRNFEKNYDGIQGYMKKILKYIDRQNLNNKTKGIVADLISIPVGYEEAIAVALGKSSTQIVTATEKDAKELILKLKKDNVGRATFLPLNFLKSKSQNVIIKEKGFLGFAKDIVKYKDEYKPVIEYLLGKVIIAESIEDAINISKRVKGYFKIVTLEGDVIITNGPITGGSKNKNRDNIFKRKQELEKLVKKGKELTAVTEEFHEFVQKTENKANELNDEIVNLKELLVSNKTLKNSIEIEYQVLVSKLEVDTKQYEQIEKTRISYETEIERENLSIGVINDAIKDLEVEKSKIENVINDTSGNLVDEVYINEINQKIINRKIEIAKNDEKINNMINSIDEKNSTLENLRKDIYTIKERITDSNNQIIDEMDLLDNKRNSLSDLQERLKVHIEKKKSNKQFLEEKEIELDKSFDLQKTVENSTNIIRQKIHELELEIAKFDIKISNLSNKLWEIHELSIIEARNRILSVTDFLNKTEFKKLRRRLKEIEHVNLNSIQEYDELKERYDFMLSQIEDLVNSKDELTKFIKQMERKITKIFIDSFNRINEEFKIVFNELFGGGYGEIRLTDPSDILGTDINIMASPPGKKMENISLLSGGEKALTAIALLFAVLKAKPTPFCVLDEIEASLDDVNVYRFGKFVREFAKESQFILITHRKGTMEFADALYGVSMEEYGISKIVSIKLSDYDFEEDADDKELIQ